MSQRMSFRVYSYQDSVPNFQPYCDKPMCQNFYDEQDKDGEEYGVTVKSMENLGPFAYYSPRLEDLRILAGAWDSHRFEKQFWPDINKPFVKMDLNKICPRTEVYSNEEIGEAEEYEEEDIQSDILNDDMIAASLTYLERSPINLKFVLCKCDLSDKELSDITAIKYYHYLQYLDVSKNGLTTLAALGQLPFLQYLDASYNYLEEAFDFKAPLFLTHVNLRYNSIRFIPDLTEFWSITNLDLSHNNIEKIEGMENLKYLSYLDLSFNKIMALENLNNLRIQYLSLHHNIIDNGFVEDDPIQFKTMDCIRMVDLSHNNISSLEMFDNAESIETIEMVNNNISNLMELYYLRNLRYLSRLNLKNNSITCLKYYANVCMDNVKNLLVLDEKTISAERRIGIKTDNSSINPGKTPYPELILLQQINYPAIEPLIVPVNYPLPVIIIIVGPPGSKKKQILRKFCKMVRSVAAGVSHTTRPRTENEIDGEDYYFITNEDFKELTRTGKFMAVSEFNGYSYGIANEEIYRTTERTVIFHSDINTALSMRIRGANPKLVLAMPRCEKTHLKWLKEKYLYDEAEHHIIRIKESPSFQTKISRIPISVTLQKQKVETISYTLSMKSGDTAYYSITDSTEQDTTSSRTLKQDIGGKLTLDTKRVSFSGNAVPGATSAKAAPHNTPTTANKVGRLDLFFKMIIQSRQKLLETHWSYPGLFHSTIFTDEARASLRKLKSILKDVAEVFESFKPSSSMTSDATYERIVGIRLSSLDLQGFAKLIQEDIPPHCDCDVKYIEKHF